MGIGMNNIEMDNIVIIILLIIVLVELVLLLYSLYRVRVMTEQVHRNSENNVKIADGLKNFLNNIGSTCPFGDKHIQEVVEHKIKEHLGDKGL
jgi:uncharacterized protein HemY